jgi:hypothetical protein
MKTIAVARPDSDIPDNDKLEKSLYLKITPSNQAYLSAALARIKQSKGKNRLYVYYEDRKTLTVSKDIFCNVSEELVSELKEILGGENVAFKIKDNSSSL